MNVYMIREDGEDKLWLSPTMRDALALAEDNHVMNERARSEAEGTEEEWRDLYRKELLESCTLIGEVANP